MRSNSRTVILAALLLSTLTVPGHAAAGCGQNHPCGAMPGMMKQNMGEMPCMMAGGPGSGPCAEDRPMPARHHRMERKHGMHMQQEGCGMMGMDRDFMPKHRGMMPHRMGRMLFLDRVEALGLTEDQVFKLKAIHAECRRENIRQEAEARITRLELKDLLDESNWIPAAAEKLIRKIKTIEGDMQVRHLRAVAEARKVLTPEQLRKADAGGAGDQAESLFK